MNPGRLAGSLGAALLLAAIFVQQATATRWTSAVVDEPAHLTAGYLSLVEGDLTVNREHPPFLKALAALPLLPLHPVLPAREPGGPAPGTEDFEFQYSRQFLYGANDADRLLSAARFPIIALTLLLGAVVFVWSREIAGTLPALAALALFAFEPNILAHGRLVTTDLGAALFVVATLWTLRMVVRRGSPVAAVACGIFLGLALLSKFSTLLVLPVALLMVLLDRTLPAPDGSQGSSRRPGAERLAILGAVVVCTAWFLLLAGYGFAGFPLPDLYQEGLSLAREKNATVEGPTYLMGSISESGFLSYYLVALAVKSPLPLLALFVAGAAAALARPASRREVLWFLVPAIAWIAAMSLLTRAQIGVRYVLPAIPFLCATAGAGMGALAERLRPARKPLLALLVAAGLLWQAGSVLAHHPYHLSWFNAVAGGPAGGWRWLTDSNIDWGQDLGGLRRWQEEAGNPRVNLYYFGTADPDYHGILRHPYGAARPGWFAVSATHLTGVYLPDPDYLKPLRDRVPDATVGGSILLYNLAHVPPGLDRPLLRPVGAGPGGSPP